MQEITSEEIYEIVGKENPLILDVGCYDGSDSAKFTEIFKNAEVYCFECDPRSQALFKKLNEGNDKLHLSHFALGSEAGVFDFYQSDSETRRHYDFQEEWSASGSLRHPQKHLELFPDVQFNSIIKVYVTTLDKWYNKVTPRVIDWLHADVNGAEGDIVRGGIETLTNKVRYLYVEFSNKQLYEGQVSKDELLKLLPTFEEVKTYNEGDNFGNVLLKNNNL